MQNRKKNRQSIERDDERVCITFSSKADQDNYTAPVITSDKQDDKEKTIIHEYDIDLEEEGFILGDKWNSKTIKIDEDTPKNTSENLKPMPVSYPVKLFDPRKNMSTAEIIGQQNQVVIF